MTSKQVGGGLVVVSIALLLVAAFTRNWWVASEGGFSLGLLGAKEGGETLPFSAFDPKLADQFEQFMWFGRITLVLSLATVFAAGLLLRRLLPDAKPSGEWIQPAAFFTGAAALGLVVALPERFGKEMSFGYSFYLLWAGLVLAVAGEKLFRDTAVAAAPQPTKPRPVKLFAGSSNEDDDEEEPDEEDEEEEEGEGDHEGERHAERSAEAAPTVGAASDSKPQVAKAETLAVSDTPPPSVSKTRPALSPACPQCRAPTTWVEEHERFFCKRCDAYLDK